MSHGPLMRRLLAVLAATGIAALAFAEQPAGTAAPPAHAPVPEAAVLVTDLVAGIGEEALPGMIVIVHYTGWLFDAAAKDQRGRKFDSSRDRGQPFSFPLGGGRVIRGWEQGVPGMKVGGTRRLVIPPALAYGTRGAGNGVIPPGATLLFEIELLAVETVTL
ncbi:MAG TPA: FKBP-type peptidyl-prolyl cis-trans isomerase, partial [Steroidobacteraceae bacterium]|nr:FKBP-type peptidyl-prolyl cis-trans isomerase [Steroidobacteraceae bacterium]